MVLSIKLPTLMDPISREVPIMSKAGLLMSREVPLMLKEVLLTPKEVPLMPQTSKSHKAVKSSTLLSTLANK
jgi:hypothetical protein